MRLHEEYISRHKLRVPIVRYDCRSQVILKSQGRPCHWRILSAYWRSGGYQPGYFEISYKMPIHNGYHKESMLGDVMHPRTAYWDSYEGCILDLIDVTKSDFIAVSSDEAPLASWCIFLLIYDNWLALNMPPEFYEFAAESISERPIACRWVAYEKSLRYIRKTRAEEVFEYQIKPWASAHSEWLENLIND